MRGAAYNPEDEADQAVELSELLRLLDDDLSRSVSPPSPGAQSRPAAGAFGAGPAAKTKAGIPPPDRGNELRTGTGTGSSPPAATAPTPLPPPPDTRSFNACIAACRRGGQFGLARLFFHEMLSRELKPDVWTFKSAMLARSRFRPAATAAPTNTAAAAAAAAPAAASPSSPRDRSASRPPPGPARRRTRAALLEGGAGAAGGGGRGGSSAGPAVRESGALGVREGGALGGECRIRP